jgi:hypothetical protein
VEVQIIENLKQSLTMPSVLALPSLEKPFYLFVNVDKGTALGVLTQEHRGKKPVAYLSKLLNPVSQGWPECIQVVVSMALLTEETQNLIFGGSLMASVPHQVRTILQQKLGRWLTDSRILKYEAIILGRDDLVLTTKNYLNPAEFLLGGKVQDPMGNCCLDFIKYQTKIRPDLRETPFLDGLSLFVDSSSRVIQEKNHNGYLVVDGVKLKSY